MCDHEWSEITTFGDAGEDIAKHICVICEKEKKSKAVEIDANITK